MSTCIAQSWCDYLPCRETASMSPLPLSTPWSCFICSLVCSCWSNVRSWITWGFSFSIKNTNNCQTNNKSIPNLVVSIEWVISMIYTSTVSPSFCFLSFNVANDIAFRNTIWVVTNTMFPFRDQGDGAKITNMGVWTVYLYRVFQQQWEFNCELRAGW